MNPEIVNMPENIVINCDLSIYFNAMYVSILPFGHLLMEIINLNDVAYGNKKILEINEEKKLL